VIPLLIGIAVIAAGFAIYWLVVRVTARGGAVEGDAAWMAAQILAEAEGFTGSRVQDATPWDGEHRLAPPPHERGGLGGAF
jgi:hypothetical protein